MGIFLWSESDQEKKQASLVELCRSLKLNAGDRIDWTLQEDITPWQMAGVAGELILGCTTFPGF